MPGSDLASSSPQTERGSSGTVGVANAVHARNSPAPHLSRRGRGHRRSRGFAVWPPSVLAQPLLHWLWPRYASRVFERSGEAKGAGSDFGVPPQDPSPRTGTDGLPARRLSCLSLRGQGRDRSSFHPVKWTGQAVCNPSRPEGKVRVRARPDRSIAAPLRRARNRVDELLGCPPASSERGDVSTRPPTADRLLSASALADLRGCPVFVEQVETAAARRWVVVPETVMADVADTCPREERTAERRLFPGFTETYERFGQRWVWKGLRAASFTQPGRAQTAAGVS